MKHYIYVDNSNLFIEGQRTSAVRRGHAPNVYEAMNKGILDFDWNLDYGRLYEIVCGSPDDVAAALDGRNGGMMPSRIGSAHGPTVACRISWFPTSQVPPRWRLSVWAHRRHQTGPS